MNLSKITYSATSFLFITALSTCAVAGTADMMKKQLLQQLKTIQLASNQKVKVLKKAVSGSNEITVADSVVTYSWENVSWEKNGCTRYSYDSKGWITEEIIADEDGFDSKNRFEYDPDGKTITHTSILNLSFGGEFFSSETTYSVFKYYPGYTNAIIQSNMSEYTALIDLANFIEYYGLDSVVTVAYDGSMDTTFKSSTNNVKINNQIVRANITFISMTDDYESVSYHVDYIASGSDGTDTMKCKFHFDEGTGSLYEELLSEMQYMMIISKKNQSNVVEQTVLKATDSTFAICTGDSKMSFYVNSNGDIDSMITQEWDTLTQVWENSEKVVYSLKKINVGVNRNANKWQAMQQIASEWKNGNLQLTIPEGVTVTAIEQLDIQGKVIAKISMVNADSRVIVSPFSSNANKVSLVRLKTDRGEFTCKVSSVK
ncbi:MAG TPA: hypothetical protein VHO70_04525 [Chitinispirillaceae bacterium]|nr:hypothetical protein [Chitinispirillaceae bacterium]